MTYSRFPKSVVQWPVSREWSPSVGQCRVDGSQKGNLRLLAGAVVFIRVRLSTSTYLAFQVSSGQIPKNRTSLGVQIT